MQQVVAVINSYFSKLQVSQIVPNNAMFCNLTG